MRQNWRYSVISLSGYPGSSPGRLVHEINGLALELSLNPPPILAERRDAFRASGSASMLRRDKTLQCESRPTSRDPIHVRAARISSRRGPLPGRARQLVLCPTPVSCGYASQCTGVVP